MGSPEDMLLYVIDQENYVATEALVSTGFDLNYRNSEGFTPLLCATEKGNYALVKMLIDHGADCNYMGKLQNEHGNAGEPPVVEWSPLFNAVLYGHAEVAGLLVERGADVNYRDLFGRSALTTAVQRGDEKCVKILIKNGADISSGDPSAAFLEINMKKILKERKSKQYEEKMQKNQAVPPLHFAVLHDDRDSLRELIKKGSNLNVQDKKGNTALHVAAENGHVGCAELLMKRGANANIQGSNGNTVLHIAASLGIASLIPLIVENGADVDCRNRDDLTPLAFAVFHSHPVSVKQLLNCGANVNTTFDDGKTALHVAVSKCNDCIDILIKEKADIFAKDIEGVCPLELAIEQGFKCFKKLFPGKYNVTSPDGESPLHFASRSGKKDTLEFMIKSDCDVNVQTKKGDTPLHFACMFDQLSYAAKSLLEGTPVRESTSNVHLLLQAGADIKKKNKSGLAPVHVCALKGTLLALKVLKDHGADINLRGGKKKQTALHIASEQGSLRLCKFLLDIGADKNAVDADRNTPLMLTARNANFSCVRLFLEYDALLWANIS